MNKWIRSLRAMICLFWLTQGLIAANAAEDPSLPHFQEVLRLIRTNLPEVTESELNSALVQGLIAHFQPRVELKLDPDSPATPAPEPWVTMGAVYEDTVGYLRVRGVGAGLPEELSARWSELRGTNRIDALILDLRFAAGQDYAAAANAAALFVRGEKPLLAWDNTVIRSANQGGPFPPLAVVVNGETQGAAEALAAALRDAGTVLIIGSRTLGQAYVYREFELDGRTLRIASTPVETGSGRSLREGVEPDIEARIPLERERLYYEDPYTTLPGEPVQVRSTRPRMTEAELVRMRRGEPDLDLRAPATGARTEAQSPATPTVRELRDPALVLALDVLKGIIIVGPSASVE